MGPIAGQILLQFVFIAINAIFAATEIALISLNENKLRREADAGDKRAAQMLKIVRTASYDEEEVLNSYSSKSRISYVKENLNLFEEEIPESGLLEELMSDKTQTDGDDEQIDADQSGETFEDGSASDNLPLNEEDGEAQGEQEPAAE